MFFLATTHCQNVQIIKKIDGQPYTFLHVIRLKGNVDKKTERHKKGKANGEKNAPSIITDSSGERLTDEQTRLDMFFPVANVAKFR